jgi:colanic acid/amylovoran biosynthesis glycosyltransferase
MKIGIVLPSPPSYSETFFNSKIAGLKANGHDIYVFVNSNKGESKDLNLVKQWPVYQNPLKTGLFIGLALMQLLAASPKKVINFYRFERSNEKSFYEIAKKIYINAHILRYDLDWLHFGFATMAIDRENVAKAVGAKMAVSFRGYDIGVFPLKNPGCYNKLWAKVDKIHTISDDLLKKAFLLGLNQNTPVSKITPAINVPHFRMKGVRKYNDNIIKILTVARLHWKKGLEYALIAVSLLKRKGYNIEYTIVGSGDLYEKLIYEANDLEILNEVRFFGKTDHENIIRLMHQNDIYLQPSIQEGFCNSVLEAQAAGMLSIVTNAEGLSENVIHNQTGWLLEKRNPNLLASKIEEIYNLRDSEKSKISEAAVRHVSNNFKVEDQISSFLKFYLV